MKNSFCENVPICISHHKRHWVIERQQQLQEQPTPHEQICNGLLILDILVVVVVVFHVDEVPSKRCKSS